MEKVNVKQELKPLYQPSSKEVVRIDVPTMNFLMVDGEGDPNTSQPFKEAIEALYSLSYTLKFMIKKGPGATCGRNHEKLYRSPKFQLSQPIALR